MRRVLWLLGFLGAAVWPVRAIDGSGVIEQWLGRQTNVQSWSADFRQIRTLKSLTQPLVSTGEVWFAAPRDFRWQLGGTPPKTIALRSGDMMEVLYPRLKRAERYDFGEIKDSQMKDTLSLLQTGFPRSEQELEGQFNLLSAQEQSGLFELNLQPKAAGARKMMPEIKILIATNDYSLAGTELIFADGSSMRNEFFNTRTNPAISNQFSLQIPADYKVVEPIKAR